nr:PAS domain S-box protein [Anaerolineae bacterium]
MLLYLIPYIASLVISGGVGIYSWRRRATAGTSAYAWVALGSGLWTLGYLFELAANSLEGKIFWDTSQFVGMFVVAIAFLAFAHKFTRIKRQYPRWIWILLSIVPAILMLFYATNSLHHRARPTAWLEPHQPFSILVYDFSTLDWIGFIYAYGLILSGIIILLTRFFQHHSVFRMQISIILLGTLIPAIGSLFPLMGVWLTAYRDPAPLTFALGNLIVAWGLFRFRLFDIAPAARATVINGMADVVVVIDAQQRIVDLNHAALAALEKPMSEVIGQPVDDIYADWPDLVERYKSRTEVREDITVETPEGPQYFEVNLTPLFDSRDRFSGRVLVLHDITDRVISQQELNKHRDDLDKLVKARTADLEAANLSLKRERDLVGQIAETSPVGITVVNDEGQITFANARAEQILGLAKEEITQRTYNAPDWQITDYDGNPFPEEQLPLSRVRETRKPVYGVRHAIVHPDGKRVLLSINASPLRDNGNFAGMVSTIEDVTARVRTEEMLQASETKYRNLFEQANDAIFIIDGDKFMDCNHTTLALFGCTREQILGQSPVRFSPDIQPDGRASEESAHEKLRQAYAGTPQCFMWQHTKYDGTPFDAEVVLSRIDLPDQSYLHATVRDITERKRLEETLREREESYRAVVETQTEFVVRNTPDGIRTFVNPAYCRYFNLSPDEAIGTSFFPLVPDEVRLSIQEKYARLTPDHPTETDSHQVVLQDGSIAWQEWTETGIFDDEGHLIEIQAVGRDITENRQAEITLREERDRAQQYLDVAGVMFVVIRADQTIELINAKGCEVLGCEEADIIGRNWFDTCVPERMRPEVKAVFASMMAGEITPTEYFENPVMTKSGEERIIAWHNAILRDAEGHIVGTLSSGEDVTERKQAEERLRASEERFRRLVNTIPYGVEEADCDGVITFSNPAHHQIQGFAEGALVGKHIWDFVDDPAERDALEAYYRKIIAEEPDPEVYYGQDRTQDGRLIDTQVHWDYVRDEAGQV